MLFTKVPIPRRLMGDSPTAPQVTITAPSRSNSQAVRRSQTAPPLRVFPQFRNVVEEQTEYYAISSDDEADSLHPRSQQIRKNGSGGDAYLGAPDISPSGDDTEASESSADFAEAVGSAASNTSNTILGFDTDDDTQKSPQSRPFTRRESNSNHFSPIPLITANAVQSPVSALSALIKAKEQNSQEENDLAELYASFSGKGDLKPLHLQIFRPTGGEPMRPVDVIVRQDATVAETIGFSLYRYWEEGRKPSLKKEECDANVWTLRIMEDVGVVDDDFPALERVRPISRFQFDMFALVEATPEQGFHLYFPF
jgi:SAPK-interacting protein 1 (Sin1), middle CRIM domain